MSYESKKRNFETMNTPGIQTTIRDAIATISFYHPASNSLPSTLLEQLTHELNTAGENESVHVIILKSEGDRAFCAGASFDELLSIDSEEKGIQFFMGFANVLNAIRTCGKIVIGSIQGKAVGGGVGLAAACDYCFATDQAAIKLSELFIGIGAFVIEPAVARKLGKAAFCQLTLDATEWHSATWAQEKGLYAKVYDSKEAMTEATESLAEKLAKYNADALGHMKKVFWEGTAHWPDLLKERAGISGTLVRSDFTKQTLKKLKK